MDTDKYLKKRKELDEKIEQKEKELKELKKESLKLEEDFFYWIMK